MNCGRASHLKASHARRRARAASTRRVIWRTCATSPLSPVWAYCGGTEKASITKPSAWLAFHAAPAKTTTATHAATNHADAAAMEASKAGTESRTGTSTSGKMAATHHRRAAKHHRAAAKHHRMAAEEQEQAAAKSDKTEGK